MFSFLAILGVLLLAAFGPVLVAVEDAGMEPARTLGTALPVLLVGGSIVLYAWWTALGSPD